VRAGAIDIASKCANACEVLQWYMSWCVGAATLADVKGQLPGAQCAPLLLPSVHNAIVILAPLPALVQVQELPRGLLQLDDADLGFDAVRVRPGLLRHGIGLPLRPHVLRGFVHKLRYVKLLRLCDPPQVLVRPAHPNVPVLQDPHVQHLLGPGADSCGREFACAEVFSRVGASDKLPASAAA